MKVFRSPHRVFSVLLGILALLEGASSASLGVCGPFTDVSDAGFCPFVLEIFTLGITTGTTPTTYDPGSNASRLQMAAFLSRTVDRALQRGSRRAALRQFWTTNSSQVALTATLAGQPLFPEFDGADIWVGLGNAQQVARIRASDGAVLETWTGLANGAAGVLVAMGRVFVAAFGSGPGAGRLYRIDPSLPAGAATTVATSLGQNPLTLAFDGGRIWTANEDGTVSIVTPADTLPWTVTTTGGYARPRSILYDGANIWVTDSHNLGRLEGGPQIGTLHRLNSAGDVLQTVTLGPISSFSVFDGSNIWVTNGDDSMTVVRASSGAILATLTGNGLSDPVGPAFDGQRVLVANIDGSVSLWKAADLTPLGSFPLPAGSAPFGACSDGVNFWIALNANNKLARF